MSKWGPILETPKRSTTPAEELASWFMAQSEHSPSQALLHACCTCIALAANSSVGLIRLPPTFETRPAKKQAGPIE